MKKERSLITIVLPDPDERELLSDAFSAGGYRVRAVADIAEAQRYATRKLSHAVLLDTTALSSAEILRVKQLPVFAPTPFFLLLPLATPEEVALYTRAGIHALFLRRIHAPRDIVRVVHHALSL